MVFRKRLVGSLKYRYKNLPDKVAIQDSALMLKKNMLELKASQSNNPLTKSFRKYFSQSDEDHITLQILNRLTKFEILKHKFIEFGSGNGVENNTLILKSLNWEGIWIDGKDLEIVLESNSPIKYLQTWITRESLAKLLPSFSEYSPSLISMDLDGNDYYFVKDILESNLKPEIFICEYNGFFPPEIEWVQPYFAGHQWDGSNYYGASLKSYVLLFKKFGYSLICCNLTGVTAFFIRNDVLSFFSDISLDIESIYVNPLGFNVSNLGMENKKIVQSIVNFNANLGSDKKE